MKYIDISKLANYLQAELLCQNSVSKFKYFIYDSRKYQNNCCFVPYIGDRFNSHRFIEELKTQGLKHSLWQKDQLPYPSDINLILVEDINRALFQVTRFYAKYLTSKVIAITGTNGKTSTKDLIANMLKRKYRVNYTKANLNNEIGIAQTILNTRFSDSFLILEIGLEKPGDLSFAASLIKFDLAIITSIGHAHLNYLKNLTTVINEKLKISQGLKKDGILIYPLSIQKYVNYPKAYSFDFSNQNADFYFKAVAIDTNAKLITNFNYTYMFKYLTQGQITNSLIATIVVKILSLKKILIKELFNVKLTNKRNNIEVYRDYIIYDDSYKANLESMIDAIESLNFYSHQKTIVLGDMLDLDNQSAFLHLKLIPYLEKSKAKVILYGKEMKKVFDNLLIQDKYYCDSFEQIIDILLKYPQNLILFKASNSINFSLLIKKFKERII